MAKDDRRAGSDRRAGRDRRGRADTRSEEEKRLQEEKGGRAGIGDPVWIDGRTLRAALSAITKIDIEALA
jgi:hypothetical protein